jgi:regulator of CtrA degradation
MSNEIAPEVQPTVAFAARLASSPAFKDLFRDGMALVEETATYLDGPGRVESKALDRGAALAYATESMRLTTRLMQLASWLLLQRAVNEGELTQEQAAQEKCKVRLTSVGAATPEATLNELPESLRELIAKAMRLQERVIHMDRLLYTESEAAEAGPRNMVAGQIDRLAAAFGMKR